jgi:penicillin-binding protein 2D
VKDFTMPDGVQSVLIDPDTLQLATANCPTTREEVYVAGSAPAVYCEVHGGHASTGSILSRVFGGGEPKAPPLDANGQPITQPVTPYDPNRPPNATGQGPAAPSADSADKKKNPLQKIFGIFGGKKKEPDKAKPQQQPPPEKGDSP